MTEAEIKAEAKFIHDTVALLNRKIKNLYKQDIEVTLRTRDCDGGRSLPPALVSHYGLEVSVERLEKIKRHEY